MEFIIGLVIGLVIGATGIGGGTLMAPALIFILGFGSKPAVATALLFSSLAKALASGLYMWRRKIDMRVLAYLLYGGVPGAIVGAIILEKVKSEKSEAWVSLTLGIVIVLSASISLIQFTTPNERTKPKLYLLSPIAFLIGAETGFSSAGAGALGAIILFNFTSLAPAVVVGTDLVFGLVVSTLAGSILIGSCDYLALSKLVPSGIIGVLFGSRIAFAVPISALRKLVLLYAILLGALLVRRGIAGMF